MEAFLLSHSNIAADIEDLYACKLDVFKKKDTLDTSFKASLYSDALLAAQKPVYHLQADKSIVFPNKEALKKHPKPIALWWTSAAAAAILLAFVLWWKPTNKLQTNRMQIRTMAVNDVEPIHLPANQHLRLYALTVADLLPEPITDIENTPKEIADYQYNRTKIAVLPSIAITSVQSNNPVFDTQWESELELIFAFQERREHINSTSIPAKRRRSIVAIVGRVFWRLTKHQAKQIQNDIWPDSQQLFSFKEEK